MTNNNQTEAILESNYEKYEEQNGAALQISFSSFHFAENVGHSLLEPNVLIEDEDGHEYIVKQFDKTRTSKSIVATHIYYKLVGHRKYDSFTGNHHFNAFADWLFAGTGWTYMNVDVTETLTFNVFGNDNFLQLIQRLITKFNCEMQILPNKVIRFAKIIGQDNDLQYRFKHNIKELSQSIDTKNIRTRIVAYGADGLTVTYTSSLADNPLFGILDAEPVTDESITTEPELLEFAKASLNDVPETNIDASVIDTDGNVGDTVWVIHEEMDLLYQTRILSKKTTRHYADSVIEIGNTKKRTMEDVLVNQKQKIEENKENIESVKEELGVFEEETAQTIVRLEERDDSILLEVEAVDRTVASLEIRADQIQTNVINLENDTRSSFTQLSDQMNLKVTKGESITDINLTPGVATINADKINLNGAVIVNGSISGATDIEVKNNVAVGNALYFGGYRGSFDFIEASGYMNFQSFGDFYFGGGQMYLNGARVLTEYDLPIGG